MKTETALTFDKVQQVAAILGGAAAHVNPDANGHYYITLTGGESIFLAGESWHHNKGRIQISGGQWPTYIDAAGSKQTQRPDNTWDAGVRLTAPRITISSTKSAAQIAADIQRRFLPDFLKVWALCQLAADRNAAYLAKRQAGITEFAKITGGHVSGRENADVTFPRGRLKYPRIDGVGVTYDIELSDITPVEMARIMGALKAEDRCDDCDEVIEDGGMSCPDGAYICRRCFDAGAH